MNEKKAAVWRKRREMGRKKYVLVNGMAAWGLSLTVVTTALQFFSQGIFSWGWVLARLIVFAFIGFLIASVKWNSGEQKLAELEKGTPGTSR